jgi:hypothetical protein
MRNPVLAYKSPGLHCTKGILFDFDIPFYPIESNADLLISGSNTQVHCYYVIFSFILGI